MATRVVEGKKPYTGGDAIDINQNKVISLKLRDENNLIIYDSGDDEIYVDLQLADGIEPTDAFPVGVTTGRVLVADEWDKTGTLICAKTTSGDNIKLLYADDGTLLIDNGTGTFKQIYLSTDIATILTDYATKEYVDAHDTIISSTEPEDPYEGMIWYNTGTDKLKVYNGASWQDIGSGGGGSSYTAGYGIDIDANDEISVDTSEIATQSDLSSKQDELVSGTNIKTINNESLLGSGDITISGGGADIEYKTQAEYDALPSSKLTDGKHYVIYTADTPTPPTPWQPGANTVLYVPMDADLLDHGPNSITLNNTGISLVPTQASVSVGYFDGNASLSGGALSNLGDFHVSVWVKLISTDASQFIFAGVNSGDIFLGYQTAGGDKIGIGRNGIAWDDTTNYTLSRNTWYLLSFDRQGSTLTFSVGSSIIGTHSNSRSYPTAGGFEIGDDGAGNTITGYMSDLIVESVGWTAQEVADYYDQTKSLYGIS